MFYQNILYSILIAAFTLINPLKAGDNRVTEMEEMIESQLVARGIAHEGVLRAMREVPRHKLVPASQKKLAYSDRPLPIGFGQTISQPYIVALMTEKIDPKPHYCILEIGTGSGYHAAVLSHVVSQVFTIEIIEELGLRAKNNLSEIGYNHIEVNIADGYYGWEEAAPFDAIIVTAAAEYIPPSLVEQLKVGGKMIIPVGSPYRTQNLILVHKDEDGIRTENLQPVMFVPFESKK